MLIAEIGYVGIAHCENEMIDIAAAVDPRAVRRFGGPQQAVAAVLSQVLGHEVAFSDTTRWLAPLF